MTALFVDIDGFKQINDRFGHQAGDEVLRQVGARLKTVLRDSDTVGRLGGDEFVMLIDSLGLDAAPELVAERILDVLRQPIGLPQSARPPISVTASIGIATGRPASAEELMQDADLALYKAKAAGKDGYVKFESAMQTAARGPHRPGDGPRRTRSTRSSSSSSTSRCSTSRTSRSSASRRCCAGSHPTQRRDPTRRVHPDRRGQRADRRRSAAGCSSRPAPRAPPGTQQGHRLNISVNVSARQLERPEFVEEVRTALRDSGLDPATLTLEITETVLMRKPDDHRAAARRAEGARRAHRGRRLRHGLQLARLPAPVPRRLAEDRPHFHHQPGALQRGARADAHPDPARQGARPGDARRGSRAAQPGPRSCSARAATSPRASCSPARSHPTRSSASSQTVLA